ncbi:InlB B-repeat-containing protein, partial [Lacrimispora amygdalina]|uniref:InlB B-repeat-containing protein n=1 Tax=Lacrimispora amygdalina TaxID=253257 RepID=UPI001A9A418D
MKTYGKRVLSFCLAVIIAVTTVGYAPPSLASAAIKSSMEDAVSALASPSQAAENVANKATPSEAESPGDKATPSEAESSGDKATPSEAVRKFVQMEPEEIPEYYSEVKKSGKRFWKFEDRNGMVQYRDFGYVNGEAEFPLWYEADQMGSVEDMSSSITLDEEYYDLAPYLYESTWPEKSDWEKLSNKLFGDNETISKCTRDMSSYQNWDKSDYTVWKLAPIDPDDENLIEIGTRYYFYGVIKNAEREAQASWFDADQNGDVFFYRYPLTTMLAVAPSNYITVSYSAPGTLWSADSKTTINSNTYLAPSPANRSPYRDYDGVVQDKLGYSDYKLIGWVTGSVNIPTLSVKDTKGEKSVTVYGNPADVGRYVGETTLYKPGFDINVYSGFKITGVWCATSYYHTAIFYKDDLSTYVDNNYERKPSKVQAIISTPPGPIDMTMVAKPTKPGYTFQCWQHVNINAESLYFYDGDTFYGDSNYPVEYYPVYKANENTIRFLGMNGELIEEKKVLSGDSPTAPTPPQIPGKRFKGWDKSFTNITSDMTITAQYEDVATVTIVGNGGLIDGQETYTQEVKVGSYLHDLTRNLKSQVSRAGYSTNPDKWYYFKEDGSKSNVYYKQVTDNVTVYVDWQINKYTITFENIYGSSKGTKTVTAEYGTLFKDLNVPSFEVPYNYYEFLGYYTSYSNGELISPETPVTKNITYYARWKPATADVTWHDCFQGQEQIYKSTINIGSTPSPSTWGIPELTRNGYQKVYVTKWYTEPNGQGKPISNDLLFEYRTLDVYAYWQPMKYYIYCYQNSPSNPYAYKYITHLYDTDDVELPVQEAPGGKVFIGYSMNMEGGTVYKKIGELPYSDSSSFSIYAQYANANNTVTFKDWNGTIITKKTVAYEEDAELPEAPKRSGYRFIGWDKSYKNIQVDTILTAQYEVSTQRLTLDGNGGSISGDQVLNMDFTAGDSLDQTLADGKAGASRKYYTFDGWYTDPTGGSKYPENGNKMPDTDLTIYAHWERSSSEVVFKDWNGSVLDTQEVTIGDDATPPPAVTERIGYTFTGWDKPTTNIQDHVEINALYSINGYLLTLNGNGGTLEGMPKKEVVISFDQSFDQVLKDGRDQVTRPGYHFDGWYNSASGGSSYSYNGNQMPSINMTVYAHWSPNTYEVTFDTDHVRWTGEKQKEDHTFDTELGTLPVPEIYGWKFNGW